MAMLLTISFAHFLLTKFDVTAIVASLYLCVEIYTAFPVTFVDEE